MLGFCACHSQAWNWLWFVWGLWVCLDELNVVIWCQKDMPVRWNRVAWRHLWWWKRPNWHLCWWKCNIHFHLWWSNRDGVSHFWCWRGHLPDAGTWWDIIGCRFGHLPDAVMVEMDFKIVALLLVLLHYWLKKKLCPMQKFVKFGLGWWQFKSQGSAVGSWSRKLLHFFSLCFFIGPRRNCAPCRILHCPTLHGLKLGLGWVDTCCETTSKFHLRGTPWVLDFPHVEGAIIGIHKV